MGKLSDLEARIAALERQYERPAPPVADDVLRLLEEEFDVKFNDKGELVRRPSAPPDGGPWGKYNGDGTHRAPLAEAKAGGGGTRGA